jgi:L-ribulose-5-phosphate 4-epimerase
MTIPDDGVIKFACQWQPGPPLEATWLAPLVTWRDRLWQAQQIGTYPNGIGYGNISLKLSRPHLCRFRHPDRPPGPDHSHPLHPGGWLGHRPQYPALRSVPSKPRPNPSPMQLSTTMRQISGRLSTFIIETCGSTTSTVCRPRPPAFPTALPKWPTKCGDCWTIADLLQQRILIMAGHEEGVLVFGPTLESAGQVLFPYLNTPSPQIITSS